jgi:hypothetical protein
MPLVVSSLFVNTIMSYFMLCAVVAGGDGAGRLWDILQEREGALYLVVKFGFIFTLLGSACFMRSFRLVFGIGGVTIAGSVIVVSVLTTWPYGHAIRDCIVLIAAVVLRASILSSDVIYVLRSKRLTDRKPRKYWMAQLALLAAGALMVFAI